MEALGSALSVVVLGGSGMVGGTVSRALATRGVRTVAVSRRGAISLDVLTACTWSDAMVKDWWKGIGLRSDKVAILNCVADKEDAQATKSTEIAGIHVMHRLAGIVAAEGARPAEFHIGSAAEFQGVARIQSVYGEAKTQGRALCKDLRVTAIVTLGVVRSKVENRVPIAAKILLKSRPDLLDGLLINVVSTADLGIMVADLVSSWDYQNLPSEPVELAVIGWDFSLRSILHITPFNRIHLSPAMFERISSAILRSPWRERLAGFDMILAHSIPNHYQFAGSANQAVSAYREGCGFCFGHTSIMINPADGFGYRLLLREVGIGKS